MAVATSAEDASAKPGFDDAYLYEEFRKRPRGPLASRALQTLRDEAWSKLCSVDRFTQQNRLLIGWNLLSRNNFRDAPADNIAVAHREVHAITSNMRKL